MSVLYDEPGPRAKRTARIISAVAIVAILAGAAWVVWTLGSPRTTATGFVTPGLFDLGRWDIFGEPAVWRRIWAGVVATLAMAGAGAVLAIVIGVVFTFLRSASSGWIRIPAIAILEFIRGMPVLLMMLFTLLIFSTGAYWAGVVALGLYNGAVIGEILRAGIAGLPNGQREAGLSIGLTPLATRLRIEFPQAVRNMLPIIIAQLVVLLKDTALSYVIAYEELLNGVVQRISTTLGEQYRLPLFIVTMVIYLALNLALSWVARFVARRTVTRRSN